MKPLRTTGASAAPGSSRATQSASTSQSGVACDERVPPTLSIHSSSYPSGPRAARISASASSWDWPGRSRQSHTTSHVAGTTFRAREAAIIVGATVSERIGSIIAPSGGSSRSSSSPSESSAGVRPVTAAKNASVSGMSRREGRKSASRSTSRAAFTSALSASSGAEACPARPRTRSRKGDERFSAIAQR